MWHLVSNMEYVKHRAHYTRRSEYIKHQRSSVSDSRSEKKKGPSNITLPVMSSRIHCVHCRFSVKGDDARPRSQCNADCAEPL